MKGDKNSWVNFFQWLRGRGLDGMNLIVGDKCLSMLEAVGKVFLEAQYCALLPQSFLYNALFYGKTGGQDVQGDPRLGELERYL